MIIVLIIQRIMYIVNHVSLEIVYVSRKGEANDPPYRDKKKPAFIDLSQRCYNPEENA